MSIISQPIFTPEELKHNNQLREELFKLVSSGDSILFVGSGLSMSVGFPSWDGLLMRLEDLALKIGTGFIKDDVLRATDPLQYADKIKNHFHDNSQMARYNNELHKIFEKKSPSNFKEFHKQLVKLPFLTILTTNYDTILSDALIQVQNDERKPLDIDTCFAVNDETRPLISKFLLALHKSLDFPKKVAHLHGNYIRQNEIILTKSDYEKCYNISLNGQAQGESKLSIHFLVLWSLMATRRIVFFGFGMKDPYLKLLLENVCKELWQWERPTHINVTDISSDTEKQSKADAVELREEFGIDTYFYENEDGTYQGLENLIRELHDNCFPSERKASPFNKDSNLTNDLVKEAQGSATGVMPEWITGMNKKLSAGIQNENQ